MNSEERQKVLQLFQEQKNEQNFLPYRKKNYSLMLKDEDLKCYDIIPTYYESYQILTEEQI